MRNRDKSSFRAPVIIRRLLLSWLLAVTISFGVLPAHLKDLHSLAGIAQLSLASVLIMTAIFFCALNVLGRYWRTFSLERWLLAAVFCVLAVLCLTNTFTWAFLMVCCAVQLILVWYAISGWDSSLPQMPNQSKSSSAYVITVGVFTALFILFVSIWTVCRVYSFCTPTYDFGIFSQMFYSMKTSGLPLTTLERDGLLSHFHVHVSPIYYLLLPVYCLFPTPATLQVMQAVILGSAVIPLWLISRKHGLSPAVSTILCLLLLVYPAYSGGTSYDIHENAFLTPLLLWLLYGIDRKIAPLTAIFSCLTLLVKEDAAVYVAVIAVYLIIKSILTKSEKKHWGIIAGFCMFAGAVVWFLLVTGYLSQVGDGVMTGRYRNFMYDGSDSLIAVVKSVLLCPMKALFESVDREKLGFIHLTLFPLLGLPFFTRRYERYLLLIPYVLVNLMSDYQYQHDIFFQYTYGSTALLFYLTVVNLADMKNLQLKTVVCMAALICSALSFTKTVIPKAELYPKYCIQYSAHYSQIRITLDKIPDDASVSATTFYTTYLSQRETLYDIKYASADHLLSTEYVVLAIKEDTSYKQYAQNGASGYDSLCFLLETEGYEIFAMLENTLVIYKKYP